MDINQGNSFAMDDWFKLQKEAAGPVDSSIASLSDAAIESMAKNMVTGSGGASSSGTGSAGGGSAGAASSQGIFGLLQNNILAAVISSTLFVSSAAGVYYFFFYNPATPPTPTPVQPAPVEPIPDKTPEPVIKVKKEPKKTPPKTKVKKVLTSREKLKKACGKIYKIQAGDRGTYIGCGHARGDSYVITTARGSKVIKLTIDKNMITSKTEIK